MNDRPAGRDGVERAIYVGRAGGRRSLTAAAVVGLGAIVAGSIAMGGGRTEQATTPSTAQSATTTAPAVTTVPPTTVAEQATTSSGAATSMATVVTLGVEPLAGEPTGLALFLATGGGWFVLDLDRATLRRVGGSRIGEAQLTPAGVAYGVASGGDFSLMLVSAGEPVKITARGGEYLGEGPPGRAWFRSYAPTVGSPPYEIVYLDEPDAAPQRVPLPADAGNVFIDGRGGLVVEGAGALFQVDIDGGVRRFGDGEVLDVANGRVLTHACDASFDCDLIVIQDVSADRAERVTALTAALG